jgi:uncharacterized membrane protein YphA (DoxX/SURF4 family)
MNPLIKTGRIFFAIAIACFGIHYLAFAAGVSAARPGPPWFPGAHWLSWAAGVALFVAGIGLLIDLTGRCAALVLAVALLLKVAIIHLPRVLANLHDPGRWTSAGEMLSICGGAIVLAGVLAKGLDGSRLATSSSSPTTVAGQYLFALPLFVFGAQHIMYGQFVATLIPAWIPGHVFWAYFIGGAFLASALAILTRQLAGLAAWLLGLMFFMWVLILHSPRVAASPHNGNEWTSAFVALAMCGSAWAVAGTLANRE